MTPIAHRCVTEIDRIIEARKPSVTSIAQSEDGFTSCWDGLSESEFEPITEDRYLSVNTPISILRRRNSISSFCKVVINPLAEIGLDIGRCKSG